MKLCISLAIAIAVGLYSHALAQPSPTTSSSDTVSRAEYEKLKQEQAEMRKELEEMKRQRAAEQATAASQPASNYATQDDLNEVDATMKAIKQDLDRQRMGTSQFFIGGDMEVNYISAQHEPSTFEAALAPLILWRPTDRILIESAFDIGIATDDQNESATSFDLTIADISYIVNDRLAVTAGLFVVPFGVFHNHFDPPWINKFVDEPLAFGDGGITPSSGIGLYAHGAAPIGTTDITYDVYVDNGANLFTTGDNAGQLNFDNFTDLNNNKAVGGRIGWRPRPNIEMGYSIQWGQSDPDGFETVNSLLQGVDFNWRQTALRGLFDFRTEWVWSNVEDATYQLDTGSVNFNNNRNGGYAQLCYRPTQADSKVIRSVELCSRYDYLTSPVSAPGGDTEQRLTLGANYWVTPAIVVKFDYQWDEKEVGESANAFIMQIGVGL